MFSDLCQLVSVEFDFVEIFIRTLACLVIVVEIPVLPTKLLHKVIVHPPVNLRVIIKRKDNVTAQASERDLTVMPLLTSRYSISSL